MIKRIAAAVLCGGLSACGPLTVLTVNTTQDLHDLDPGDGVCDANAAPGAQCALKAAVEEANAHPSNNILISIQSPGTYAFTPDIDGAKGLIVNEAGKRIEIRGCCEDPAQTTIEPLTSSRIFTIVGGATTLSRLRLRNGHAPDPHLSAGEVKDGGAIHLSGTTSRLEITNCLLEDNHAERQGGAVFASNDPFTLLIITDSIIRNNTAANAGVGGAGGVHSGATTVVTRTLFETNQGNSGALRLEMENDVTPEGDHTITRSTFRSNISDNQGGGAGVRADLGMRELVVRWSTFSGNSTTGSGGALTVVSGTVDIGATTMTENDASSSSNAISIFGGASVRLQSSIVAQNPSFSADDEPEIDCGTDGAVTLAGFNLINIVGESCTLDVSNSDDVGPVDADLGSYVSSPIGHHPPTPGSPAIDGGLFICDGIDQIGNPIRVDGDGDGLERCDIGAIEFQSQ